MQPMEEFQLPEGVKVLEEGFEANLNPTEEGCVLSGFNDDFRGS